MPRMTEKEKWILYKHTCDYELIKAVALDVKNNCASDVSPTERKRMQERLAALDLYKTRNPNQRPLDSINHRINTLEFYMFGYEDDQRRFIFSPLGNLFLKNINNEENLKKIFLSMLFGIQFKHYANGTPDSFQLYPFRLLFKLMREERLKFRIYSTEYAFIIAYVREVNKVSYEHLITDILEFRKLDDRVKFGLLKKNEHTSVNSIYEWQYYTQKLLSTIGIIDVNDGIRIGKLYHPRKTGSSSQPTHRYVNNGFSQINPSLIDFVDLLLSRYSCFDKPLLLNDPHRLSMDVVKEIYSFCPKELLEAIDEKELKKTLRFLELPKLIDQYSRNPNQETAYLFEDVLAEGMNMFKNVRAIKIGGADNTDIECLYTVNQKKFAVEAKSTGNKLTEINAGRLKKHLKKIGGKYTIVVTPCYVPTVIPDIDGSPIVIVLASTFSEYLYNHVFHDVREIDYKDFDDIVVENLGKDISSLVSEMTMQKFATNISSRAS